MLRLIVILASVLLFGTASFAQDIYLVAAGISDYPGTDNDLMLSAVDARAVNTLYKGNGKASTLLLTNAKATKDNIVAAMKQTFMKADKEDIVVFFFSGHGYPGGLAAYDRGLPYDDIKAVFSGCKAVCKMIFADACFSGDMRDGGRHMTNESVSGDVMLFLSCRDDEVSFESPSMKNGYFTSCLLRCLRGGADSNGDRIITANELYDAVSAGVISLSSGSQHPVMWGHFDDDMPVMIW